MGFDMELTKGEIVKEFPISCQNSGDSRTWIVCGEGILDKVSSCPRTKILQNLVKDAPTTFRRELEKGSKLHRYTVKV